MIRKLTESDLSYIDEIGIKIKDNFNKYYDLETNIKKEYTEIYVYEDKEIKGFIYIENQIDFIDLIAIAVKEENKGIGTALLKYVIESNKGKRILLEVRENNENAINLYKKCGFKEINRRKKYYDGIDAIVMEVSC